MMSMVMFIAIVGACLLATGESVTYVFDSFTRQITQLEDGDPGSCNVPGTFCASCTNVSECIDLGAGYFFRYDSYATCDHGSSCTNNTGYCTTAPNPSCDLNMKDYSMECLQIGFFPHPFNTSKYFLCSPNATDPTNKPASVAIPFTCQQGYAYDAYSNLCRVKLPPNTNGDLLILPCNSTIRGAIPNHPSMYFICLKKSPSTVFFPQLFLCNNHQFYNNATKMCQARAGTLLADGKCATTEMFYDSDACGAYTECNNGSLPIKRTCSAGWYFDERKVACTPYTCLDVKN